MKLDDITEGQKVADREFPEIVGVVERIDYDEDMVYVKFPTRLGSDTVDLDPADLVPVA